MDRTFSNSDTRVYAAGVLLSSTEWWITGGGYYSSTTGVSSELYTSATPLPGVNLPEAKYYHNLMQLNSTHVVLQGGDSTRKVFILNMDTQIWSQLPDLRLARTWNQAGLVTYPDGHKAIVVLGELLQPHQPQCQILDFTLEGEAATSWRYGPVLPGSTGSYDLYGGSLQLAIRSWLWEGTSTRPQ